MKHGGLITYGQQPWSSLLGVVTNPAWLSVHDESRTMDVAYPRSVMKARCTNASLGSCFSLGNLRLQIEVLGWFARTRKRNIPVHPVQIFNRNMGNILPRQMRLWTPESRVHWKDWYVNVLSGTCKTGLHFIAKNRISCAENMSWSVGDLDDWLQRSIRQPGTFHLCTWCGKMWLPDINDINAEINAWSCTNSRPVHISSYRGSFWTKADSMEKLLHSKQRYDPKAFPFPPLHLKVVIRLQNTIWKQCLGAGFTNVTAAGFSWNGTQRPFSSKSFKKPHCSLYEGTWDTSSFSSGAGFFVGLHEARAYSFQKHCRATSDEKMMLLSAVFEAPWEDSLAHEANLSQFGAASGTSSGQLYHHWGWLILPASPCTCQCVCVEGLHAALISLQHCKAVADSGTGRYERTQISKSPEICNGHCQSSLYHAPLARVPMHTHKRNANSCANTRHFFVNNTSDLLQ